jgi:predicted unusual protein kinase regulating ubiquinone biosynthesis (AarF/ABC1/UbiB family)
MVKSKFLSSGVYGCVYYPAYTCNGTEPAKKTATVSKIVRHEFTTKTEIAIGHILKKEKDNFVLVSNNCLISKMNLQKSAMRAQCKLFNKDPQLTKQYELLYSEYVKADELDTYLNKTKSKMNIIKTYLLLCKRIETMVKYGIIHHDLHFGNVLYNKTNLYIIDFGLSLIQTEFIKNDKPNYGYLKNAFFHYSPTWNYWTLEYHFLCYLIHEQDMLTLDIIKNTIDLYLSKHKIIHLLDNAFVSMFKQNATKYFSSFIGLDKNTVVIELLNTYTTWDFYKIALHYLDIYKNIMMNSEAFFMLLLLFIHPVPSFRPLVSEVSRFNDSLMSSYRLDIHQSHSQFSKQLTRHLRHSAIELQPFVGVPDK